MYVISHYLKINLIIVDEKMIIQNIIGDNEEIIGNNLYFLEKDDHIEPIVQQVFINRNCELKNKAQNLLKVLIALYEKNKIILLDVENKEDDLTKTIVEYNNLNLNLFIDNKPKIEYRIINRKEFNKLYQSGNVINYDVLNAYLLTKQSSCTRLFFEREKKENKDYNKEMIDEKEDEEMLKLELSCAPNKVCLKFSKIFDIKNGKYIILKYYDSLNSIQKHIYKYHPDESKNQLVVNVDFINENLILIEKDNKMNFYLVSSELLNIYSGIFQDYKNIKINGINDKVKSIPIDTKQSCSLNIIREQDIYPIKINNLIPNYVSDLEDSLKFRVMELFTDKEINEFDIVEIEDDIDLKNLLKKKFMSNLYMQ